MRFSRHAVLRIALCTILVTGIVALVAQACGPDITFRAYLGGRLWQPTWRYLVEMTRGAPAENRSYVPYAGMTPARGGSLANARVAYRALFPEDGPKYFNNGVGPLNWPQATIDNLRQMLRTVSPANPAEADELELLRCKVELRAVKDGSDTALPQVRSCFEAYLSRARPPALASEARGWLARTDFLSGRGASASKFYLEELASPISNIRRERLLGSLQMIVPTEADLDNYFDTPKHALFAVNQITNRNLPQSLQAALISRLEEHANLFGQGPESNALVLALMRASIRMGAPEATLRYAERIPSSDAARRNGEYNWLSGIARFQLKDYAATEIALQAVMSATDSDWRLKAFATNGLIGIYSRLNRPLDELHAALQAATFGRAGYNADQRQMMPVYSNYFYELWSSGLLGDNFDAAYLLDIKMTDAQLREYLQRYGNDSGETLVDYPVKLTGKEAILYALAVRAARGENYDEAQKLYEEVGTSGALERAEKVREARALFAATRAGNPTAPGRLQALYNYANFLSRNENQIFYNNSLWHGFQRGAFMTSDFNDPNPADGRWKALSPDEVNRYQELERRFRDEQEEYWRAYQILNTVVEQAGRSTLGRQAATRAIYCLRRINTGRFGRSQEIRAADLRLSSWLARNP